MMRRSSSVIQITLWNSPYLGNFMSCELAFATALERRLGLRTHFVLAHGATDHAWISELEAAGFTWSVLPPRSIAWRRHIDQCTAGHDGALVHTHFTAADLHAARAAKAAQLPCIWHIRTGFNGYSLRQRAKDLVKMRSVARNDVSRIIAVSPWLADLARRRGAPSDRIDVLPDVIALDRFGQLPDRAAARQRFGLPPDATVVLGLGWWPEVKGMDILLDALQTVTAHHPRVHALLVGEQQLRDFVAQRLPAQPPWLHLSGFVEDSAWLFAASDVFVSAARHEGQLAAMGEAFASGLPAVMSDIPGTASWADAPHVWTFRSEDAAALADQLRSLLKLPAPERESAGAENRRWSLDRHNIDMWSEARMKIYEDVLGGDPSGRRPAPEHLAHDGGVGRRELP